VRPGREHDTTALRAHAEALPLLTEWTDVEHAARADLGYEGERAALTIPVKKTTDAPLTDEQRTVNLLHAATRAPAERGNSLLKITFKALRRVASARGGSAQSPPPPRCCCTTSPTALPDQTRGGVDTGTTQRVTRLRRAE
jgi:DDE superfamily endonuclease